jgi:hypothetical protein
MADISDVNPREIRDIHESLEALSCEFKDVSCLLLLIKAARIMTRILY